MTTAAQGNKVKVFLSHSSSDKPLVRRVAQGLKRRGVQVWLDEVDIRVGQSIPTALAEAIDSSSVFCVFISKSSVKSGWVTKEVNTFLLRTAKNEGIILPCRLDNCQIPVLLRELKYADFRPTFQYGMRNLLHAVAIREVMEKVATEKAIRRRHLKQIRELVVTLHQRFNNDELSFFVHNFANSATYTGEYFEWNRWRAPYELLNALVGLGMLSEEIWDEHTVKEHWRLTPIGEEVHAKIAVSSAIKPRNEIRKTKDSDSEAIQS